MCRLQRLEVSLNWTMEKWKVVAWSDKSCFILFHVDIQVGVCVAYLGRIWQLDALCWEVEPAGTVWRFGRYSARNPFFQSFVWTYVQSRALIWDVLAVYVYWGWFSTATTPVRSISVTLRAIAIFFNNSWGQIEVAVILNWLQNLISLKCL